MESPPLDKIVDKGISFLSEFFPKSTSLYFPLLSAALVWAIKRTKEWKEKILSWKVWAEPEPIQTKPDEFVLEFFRRHPGLSQSYQVEIQKNEIEPLREAFSSLYPILALEDPFLEALFAQELDSGQYRKIVKNFKNRVKKAKGDVESVEENRLLEGLKAVADEAIGLNLELLSQAKLRKTIADLVKKSLKKE